MRQLGVAATPHLCNLVQATTRKAWSAVGHLLLHNFEGQQNNGEHVRVELLWQILRVKHAALNGGLAELVVRVRVLHDELEHSNQLINRVPINILVLQKLLNCLSNSLHGLWIVLDRT